MIFMMNKQMTIVQRLYLQNNSPNRAFAPANAFSFHIDLFAKITNIHDLCTNLHSPLAFIIYVARL